MEHEKSASRQLTQIPNRRLFAIALGIAFLIGFVPMWFLAHSRAAERDSARQSVTVLRIRDHLAAAILFARRGEYEPSRQHASEFFTQIRSMVDSGSTLNDEERDAIRPLLAQRDDIITLLARNDPAALDRLFNLEYQLRQALKQRG